MVLAQWSSSAQLERAKGALFTCVLWMALYVFKETLCLDNAGARGSNGDLRVIPGENVVTDLICCDPAHNVHCASPLCGMQHSL